MFDSHRFDLYLIRHGQSETNANPDLMGQTATVPLSDLGMRQASLLNQRFQKEKLVFDYIFSSTYTRAHDTARLAIPINQDIVTVEDLREYSAGDWVGHKRSETLTPDVLFKMNIHTMHFLPPNGESLNQVERRAAKWLEDTIVYNAKFNNTKIAVFTHGMTIKCLLHHIMGFDKSFTWKVSIDNTSISHLSFSSVGWRLHGINDTSHLK